MVIVLWCRAAPIRRARSGAAQARPTSARSRWRARPCRSSASSGARAVAEQRGTKRICRPDSARRRATLDTAARRSISFPPKWYNGQRAEHFRAESAAREGSTARGGHQQTRIRDHLKAWVRRGTQLPEPITNVNRSARIDSIFALDSAARPADILRHVAGSSHFPCRPAARARSS